jgi:hypothetical protein
MQEIENCIGRINELINNGKDVLTSEGTPIIRENPNIKSALLNETFYFGLGSYDEKQQFLSENRHKFTTIKRTMDNSLCLAWTVQVHSFLIKYLGKDDVKTKDIEYYTGFSSFEKRHIKKIISVLNGVKIAIEKGDIDIVEGVNMDKEQDENVKINGLTVHISGTEKSQFIFASDKSSVNVIQNNTFDLNQLKEILDVINKNIPSNISVEEKEMLVHNLDTIQNELSNPNPKAFIIKTAVAGLKTLDKIVQLGASLATLYTFLKPIIG